MSDRRSSELRFDGSTGPSNYSRAVRVGNVVAVSGTTSLRKDRTLDSPGDPAGQARFIFQQIAEALEEVGASMADVVRTRIFLADISTWREVNDVHAEVFGDIRPANSVLGVELAYPEMMVEIEADAVVAETSG